MLESELTGVLRLWRLDSCAEQVLVVVAAAVWSVRKKEGKREEKLSIMTSDAKRLHQTDHNQTFDPVRLAISTST